MTTADLSRRRFLQQASVYLAATGAFCVGCNTAHARSELRGCSLHGSLDSFKRNTSFYDKGDVGGFVIEEAIRGLPQFGTKYSTGLNPSFAMYDDSAGANALALNQDVVYDRSEDGVILFGVNLCQHIIDFPTFSEVDNNSILNAIIQHEYAHIAQFAYGFHSPETRRMELMADFVAGWTLQHLEKFATTQYKANAEGASAYITSVGDTEFGSADHHGTPRQRLQAYVEGAKYNIESQSRRGDYLRAVVAGAKTYGVRRG